MKSVRSKFSALKQICTYIPGHLVANLARSHGIDKKCRTFSPWSHVVSLLYAQLPHSSGLNNVCDGLRFHTGKLGVNSRCHATGAKYAIECQQKSLRRYDREIILVCVRSSQNPESVVWRKMPHRVNRFIGQYKRRNAGREV